MNDRDGDGRNILKVIREVGREFRKQIVQGTSTGIENFLNRVREEDQADLFAQLLEIEINYRRSIGEEPTSAEYIDRFPKRQNQVRRAFFEPSLDSVGLLGNDDSEDDTQSLRNQRDEFEALDPTCELSGANHLGDYELMRELGRGAFGVVYEARHRTRRNRVALKTLPASATDGDISPDRLHRFRREFRSLSEINHTNLVGMQSLEVDEGRWFFTMDLIDGTDFLGFVRPGDELDEDRLRSSLSQLARGVIALHEIGIIHRDLKPSNVLVEDTGRVVILDFGLVAHLQRAGDASMTRSGMFAGTPRYAAPEQVFGERSEASDWYALGTILYESLTGEPPFSGSHMELLHRKQNEQAPKLSINDSYPSDLAELVNGLLNRDPSERPAQADIVALVQPDVQTSAFGSTQGSRGSTGSTDDELGEEFNDERVTGQLLIGREHQLAELYRAWKAFSTEETSRVLWLTGRSGEGKSTLASMFLRSLKKSESTIVLSGRCYDRESVPFKAVDSIIEPLVRFLRSDEGSTACANLPDDIGFLARLFPLLSRVESIASRRLPSSRRIDPAMLRARGFYALRELLIKISTDQPIVIWIDDLQWGDADSAQALSDVLTQSPRPHVMLLGSYRRDEAKESLFLQNWERLIEIESRRLDSDTVAVEPLSREQCIEMAVAWLGLKTEEIASKGERLLAESSGNPYLLEQLLEGFDRETGEFQAAPLEKLIASRLHDLPSEAKRWLEIIAISGQPIVVDEAAQAAALGETDYGLLTHMRSERLLRMIGDDQHHLQVDTYHDKIRETVVGGLKQEERRSLHVKLAECIEAKEGCSSESLMAEFCQSTIPNEYSQPISPRVFDLAHHFQAADDSRAFVYQIVAAERSLHDCSADDAVINYRQALPHVDSRLSGEQAFRFRLGFGQALDWNNRTDAAIESYELAKTVAPTSIDRARALAGSAEVHLHVANFDAAIHSIDEGLMELGIPRPQNGIAQLFSIANRTFRLIFLPAKWQQSGSEEERLRSRLAFDMCEKGRIALLDKEVLGTVDINLRTSLAAFKCGGREMRAAGNGHGANIFAALGVHWLARISLRRVESDVIDDVDKDLLSRVLNAKADALYWSGFVLQAAEAYRLCSPIMQQFGNLSMRPVALHMLRHSLSYIGTTSDERSTAKEILDWAIDVDNARCKCWGNYDTASALARAGELAEASRYMKQSYSTLSGEQNVMTESIRASTNSFVYLQSSSYQQAGELATYAWRNAISNLWLIDVSLLCLPIAIEALAGPNWPESTTPNDQKKLKRVLLRARLLYRTIPNQQAHLLRVFGRACYSFGKRRKAIRYFQKAEKLAKLKEMKYQRAKCLLDLAAVKEEGRDANRAEAIALLKEMESVIPRAESWLLRDQYDEDVVAPAFDLAEWEAEHGSICPTTISET